MLLILLCIKINDVSQETICYKSKHKWKKELMINMSNQMRLHLTIIIFMCITTLVQLLAEVVKKTDEQSNDVASNGGTHNN
jgi:hypothetical protein